MIFSRHIYWVILLHVMLILVTSGTGVWLIISQRGFVIGTLLITCSLFQISRLVNKLNSFNQKLRVFFDAIEDKDNMLYFPEQNVSKEQEKLNRSLNRINFLLAKTQSEYSKQEHFYRSLLEEVPSGVLAWDSTGKIIIANSTALSLLDCQQLTRYRQLESLLQEKGKKEHLSLSQSRMKLQDETITLLSIKDIGDELSDKESESWNKLSHVLPLSPCHKHCPPIRTSTKKQFADFASFKHKANVYCNLPNPSVTSPTCQNPKRNFSHLRQPCKISGNSYPATSKKAISSSH